MNSYLAALMGILLLVIGGRFLLFPEAAATAYGVPASPRGDAGAYLTIKGLRDGVSGVPRLPVCGWWSIRCGVRLVA